MDLMSGKIFWLAFFVLIFLDTKTETSYVIGSALGTRICIYSGKFQNNAQNQIFVAFLDAR